MDSGSSCQLGGSIGVRRDLPMVLLCSFGVPLVFYRCSLVSLKASNDTIGYTLDIL